MENWIRYYVDFDSNLFSIFNEHLKKSKKEHKAINIHIINQDRTAKLRLPKGQEIIDHYKLVLDWQDDQVCGVEVYKLLEV